MPWKPLNHTVVQQNIFDMDGNVIDQSQPLKIGTEYKYQVHVRVPGAVQRVVVRALTREQYTSDKPVKQGYLYTATAVIKRNAGVVEARFWPNQAMLNNSPFWLGFVDDPTNMSENKTQAWGVGGLRFTVKQ